MNAAYRCVATLCGFVLAVLSSPPCASADEPSAASPATAPFSVPADDCDIRVFDVSPDRSGDIVRFVLGGHGFAGSTADVDFVTTKALYGLSLAKLTHTTVANASGFEISAPYGAALPDASDLKGVFVTSYTGADGIKHDCDMLDGLPLAALPYFAESPYSPAVEAQAGMREATISALPAATLFAYQATYECPVPFRKATIVRPEEPVFPDSRHLVAGSYHTIVRVDLDADGRETGATVVESTGLGVLDSAVVEAAKHSKYAPAVSQCVPAPSSYLFRSDFDAR